ncbi:MAG TPA: hypothetical protein VMV14_02465 [Acidimicrobiales bacterium]|nr:hypothetical protein [Acidimicrobiales bacterium]
MQLEAWFDGEAPDGLAEHLHSCASCFSHLQTLSRIRAGVRHGLGEVTTARPPVLGGTGLGGTEPVSTGPSVPATTRAGRLVLVAAGAAALVVAGVTVGLRPRPVHGTLSAASGSLPASVTHRGTGAPGAAGATSSKNPASAPVVPDGPPSPSGRRTQRAGRSSGAVSPVVGAALELAVIVPAQGPDSADATEVTQAVRQAVADANATGGVGHAPVGLTVVSADDTGALAALSSEPAVVVGGFGAPAPAGVPWMLPADPWATGPGVVAAELTPQAAGERLGQDLIHRGQSGTVGIIEGTGPDTALATGLAAVVPTTTVQAPADGACLPAVSALEQQGVVAVAVAGSPALSTSCVSALGALSWSPPGGVLVAPSAAYGGVASAGVVGGTDVFTVLGLPWPESSSAGAARFRRELPGVTSYRALVSFAAVEMAVEVARQAGSVSLSSVASRSWRNDLFDYQGTTNDGAQVVQASASGWASAP